MSRYNFQSDVSGDWLLGAILGVSRVSWLVSGKILSHYKHKENE